MKMVNRFKVFLPLPPLIPSGCGDEPPLTPSGCIDEPAGKVHQ